MQKYRAIVIFGPPGSGKGTQAKLLVSSEKYVHFSTGDMCRSVDAGTELGKQIRSLTDKGNLIPDKMIIDLLNQHLKQAIQTNRYNPIKQTILIDGVPRNPAQVDMLNELIILKKIIVLEGFPDDELVDRLHRRAIEEGRADDASPEIMRKRLSLYRKHVESIISKYSGELVARINGVGPVKEVYQRILKSLQN